MQHDAKAPAPTQCLATPVQRAPRFQLMQCSERCVTMPFYVARSPAPAYRQPALTASFTTGNGPAA